MIENTMIHKEIIHKEIDLIQDVIKRMANNSFLAKGWMITLLGVISALCKDQLFDTNGTFKESSVYIYIMLCLPVIMFWYLDAYFLLQERFYRHLYNWIIGERVKGNFENLYGLSPQIQFKDKKNVRSVWHIMISETLIIFYLLPVILCISIAVYSLTGSLPGLITILLLYVALFIFYLSKSKK